MQVSEVMSSNVKLASPEDTLQAIALSMSELDTGALPVGENDRLVGMVTDRDIVVRAISKGLDPGRTTAREVMSAEIYYCFVDDDVQDVAQSMSEWRVRRLPVLNADERLVGIVSLGDVSKGAAPEHSGAALRDISQQDGSQARR